MAISLRNKLILGLAVGAALFGGGFLTARTTQSAPQQGASLAAQASKYPLLSKSILQDSSDDILINFVGLRKKLQDRFNQLDPGVKRSFYFEYLPDGTSIRIGADTDLFAASLIKTPLAMNVFKAAEMSELDLDNPVTVTDGELDNRYGDLWKKGAGFKMTLREAAMHALEESDDTAMQVMYDHVNNVLTYDNQSLAGLDIDENLDNGQATISARAYTSVLKSLYYSSYLNNADSQELLNYLSQSTDKSRLVKDLPSNIVVAHKNGVNNASVLESDCGIVYVPNRPYVICAMIGLPDVQADKFIAQISKDTYDYVMSQ